MKPRLTRRGLLIGLAIGALLAVLAYAAVAWQAAPRGPITVGYFHGGRTNLFFRAYVNREFEADGKPTLLLKTRNLYSGTYFDMPPSWFNTFENMRGVGNEHFGKVTGIEIIRQMEEDNLDAGTVGESSFLAQIERGSNVVAIAELGHDTVQMPGHCICFRKGIKIRTPADMKGLRFTSRRAGPGDEVMLREFLVQSGLDPDKDVIMEPNTSDDLEAELFRDGKIDGGYLHLMSAKIQVQHGWASVYRPLDWVPANLSLAVLVVNRDVLEQRRRELVDVLKTYIRHIHAENQLSYEERVKVRHKGLQIADDFLGMNYPQCDIPPVVKIDRLQAMERLLIKHKFMRGPVEIGRFVDNSLVLQATQELGFPVDGSYRGASP